MLDPPMTIAALRIIRSFCGHFWSTPLLLWEFDPSTHFWLEMCIQVTCFFTCWSYGGNLVANTRLPGPFLSFSFSSRDSILAVQLNSVVNERASRPRLVSFTASCKHSHSYTTFYKPSHPYTASYNSG